MSAASDAVWAAELLAVDPVGLGGAALHCQVHPVRGQWIELLRVLLPPETPLRRIPCNISDSRLLGGLDLAATLAANRPIAEQGVLAASDGGIVILAMAERLSVHTTACLTAVMDRQEISQRGDAGSDVPVRVGVVAFDESWGDDEAMPPPLVDRLALLLDLQCIDARATLMPHRDAAHIRAARERLERVLLDPDLLERLCATALALGVNSPRVAILAARVARAAAALEGREVIDEGDAILAGRLVLAPRATRSPPFRAAETPDDTRGDAAGDTPGDTVDQVDASRDSIAPEPEPPPEAPANSSFAEPAAGAQPSDPASATQAMRGDTILAATQAAIPADLLARLQASAAGGRGSPAGSGRAGMQRKGFGRGRPLGVRAGPPHGSARLNVLETLRAAAPWQRLRGRGDAARLRIHLEDLRVTTYRQRSRSLTIFTVDASGSSALNRLAEAKGAVELLLAECYLRRDQVAVIAFRGKSAELVLPPTRSLVRAKRSLAGMPGGGATPLAAALAMAHRIAQQAQRRGESPTVIVLSDGRANIGRDGSAGRELAHRDALVVACDLRVSRISALFVDTSPRPNAQAQALAGAMNARYVPLPTVSSQALSAIVKNTRAGSARA